MAREMRQNYNLTRFANRGNVIIRFARGNEERLDLCMRRINCNKCEKICDGRQK